MPYILGTLGNKQKGQLAIITRTNFGLFNEAVKLCCSNSEKKTRIAFAGVQKFNSVKMITCFVKYTRQPNIQKKIERNWKGFIYINLTNAVT